ncbi:MAG: hypothetical protein JXR96_02170 [Deltaproteobacteria bacterium]|nr:hypothetical protein [Deltaproteobacteria bacterium]
MHAIWKVIKRIIAVAAVLPGLGPALLAAWAGVVDGEPEKPIQVFDRRGRIVALLDAAGKGVSLAPAYTQVAFGQVEPRSPGRVDLALDLAWQAQAQKALREELRDQGLEAGLVAVEPGTGRVRVLAASWNGARFCDLRARRPAGTAIKPLLLAAALEQGLRPESALDEEPDGESPGQVWRPRNCEACDSTPRVEDLLGSTCTCALHLTLRLGPEEIARQAQSLLIRSPLPREPAELVFGSQLDLVELTGAMAAIWADGLASEPGFGARARGETGQALTSQNATVLAGLIERAAGGLPLVRGSTASGRDGWAIACSRSPERLCIGVRVSAPRGPGPPPLHLARLARRVLERFHLSVIGASSD